METGRFDLGQAGFWRIEGLSTLQSLAVGPALFYRTGQRYSRDNDKTKGSP